MNVSTKTSRPRSDLAWHLWLPVALIVIVWFASSLSTSFYFPPASKVFEQAWEVWVPDAFITDALPSLVRLVIGFVLAVVAGILLGATLGLIPALEHAVRPLTEAIRAIPGVALLPVAMMFMGTGDTMKLVMIAFTSMWPVLLNTIEGVRRIEPGQRAVMDSFRLTPWHRLRFAYLPAALPQIFSGARISLAIAVAVMVAVEMFGTPGGIGHFIRAAQQTFRIVDMWTGLLVLGLFGYALNVLFRMLEQRVLRWHYRMSEHVRGEK
jgi:ABC-type nitrate/sulfonate/bicarbonate transport system permease component